MELKIDKEFQGIIHPLTKDEFTLLESNIRRDGCRDPLTIWHGTIIDGHHRYQICKKHGLDFKVHSMEFDSREDVIIWICQNQRGRRNISDEDREYLLGKEQEATKRKWGGDRKSRRQNGALIPEGRTAQMLADKYGVGRRTVERSAQFAKGVDAIAEVSPIAKQKILSGESGATKKAIRQLYKQPQEEIEVIARQIETDTYQKPDAPDVSKLTPREMRKRIDEAVRSMQDASGKETTSDSHAKTVAHNLLSYADGIYAYASEEYPDLKGASNGSKQALLKAIQALEVAIGSLKQSIESED